MHVFIDTNVFLSFYHYTSEDLDSLNNVFGSHAKGASHVHLTDQIRDEFKRNREAKINDALKRFRDVSSSVQLPYLMRGYKEYDEFEKLSKAYNDCHAMLLKNTADDVKSEKLAGDILIGDIFSKFKMYETTQAIYAKAKMRMDIGNPPGKRESIGDAINWLLLLENVPAGENLYLISDDADFYSAIDKKEINPFLLEEWRREKKSEVVCYKTLREFVGDHFDGVELSLDPSKMELIDALGEAGNFAATHALVAQLDQYKYFSLKEALAMLDAAVANNQFGWLALDQDVRELLLRAVMPHKKKISDDEHLKIIETVEKGEHS